MTSASPLRRYLNELSAIYGTGGAMPETSGYGALERLFGEIGGALRPRVRAVMQLQNLGAGSPDGGFFTDDQVQDFRNGKPLGGQMPARGVIEVKPFDDDSVRTARGPQVSRYWEHYRQVLVTNYHDFLFLSEDENSRPLILDSYHLAGNAEAFRHVLAHPAAAQKEAERFFEFLRRVMRHAAPLARPEDVAWFLASYAREAASRVKAAGSLRGLGILRGALEEALGLKFEGEKGDHFFRATLVQTIFYGIFSSWVLWSRGAAGSGAVFNWHEASWYLHVPMIAKLFEEIVTPSRLKPLGLEEVLDWTGALLNRVDRAEFFKRFEEEHAVQYFYEPFLRDYDPELRKDLGVWYTPPEIVKYQVGRVDAVLRSELGLARGLADDNVYILDPACGTGAYLVETLERIHETLEREAGRDLAPHLLKQAALKRVFGFEILPAPFVVSHLQMGLKLRSLGAPLAESERAGVYLTNSLTGWEPPEKPKDMLPFPELQAERDAADHVKQQTPILVVIGNPPYNAFAGTSGEEEMGLVDAYKEGLTTPVEKGGWGIRKFNLDDLYVRFFRIAERRIVTSGRGVVSYISNFSYLRDPSFVVVRKRFLDEFDRLWFDCMNGDSRETGKLTPDGKPDPSVFSTRQTPVGIRVGTAVSILVRKSERETKPIVYYRDFWGANKRLELLDSLNEKDFDSHYRIAEPAPENRYLFRPQCVAPKYLCWPTSQALAAGVYNGPVERRGNSLIAIKSDKYRLYHLKSYLDEALSDEEIAAAVPEFMRSSGEFRAPEARAQLKVRTDFDETNIVPYLYKPFDHRLAYLDSRIAPLFSRPSPALLQHARIGRNTFFIARDTADKSPEGPPFFFSRFVCDYDCISGHARHFPMFLETRGRKSKNEKTESMFDEDPESRVSANLSPTARDYLASLGIDNPDADAETAGLIWMHALAIGYSPLYLGENADGIRHDWPRIPLPASRERLVASAALGREVAALLDVESEPAGGFARAALDALGGVAVFTRDGSAGEPFALTAGWGHAGARGATMPGQGKREERRYAERERAGLEEAARSLGIPPDEAIERLGGTTLDVYLNDAEYWRNVPSAVWNYYIGGYQIIKKWLSYREKALLGRVLKADEVAYVTQMTRRLAALRLLEGRLDENYRLAVAETWAWPMR